MSCAEYRACSSTSGEPPQQPVDAAALLWPCTSSSSSSPRAHADSYRHDCGFGNPVWIFGGDSRLHFFCPCPPSRAVTGGRRGSRSSRRPGWMPTWPPSGGSSAERTPQSTYARWHAGRGTGTTAGTRTLLHLHGRGGLDQVTIHPFLFSNVCELPRLCPKHGQNPFTCRYESPLPPCEWIDNHTRGADADAATPPPPFTACPYPSSRLQAPGFASKPCPLHWRREEEAGVKEERGRTRGELLLRQSKAISMWHPPAKLMIPTMTILLVVRMVFLLAVWAWRTG